MALKSWSTTAGDNDDADATINWAENQAPSTVNNSARAMMAAIREWYEDLEWKDLGHTVTRTGNTTFTIAADVTTTYVANRPIRCTDSSTLYGVVASSSFSSPNTTVTVTLDSGNLSASLTAVSLGPTPTNLPISVQTIRNGSTALLASANAWTGNQTHAGTETFNSTVAINTDPTITSTDAGATAGPLLNLDRNSATPAASDVLGAIPFKGRDSGGGTDTYAQVQGEIVDTTATSEDGRFAIQTVVAGTLATRAYVGQGLVVGSPTDGDKGAGSINATNYYINGAAIGASSSGAGLAWLGTFTLAGAQASFVIGSSAGDLVVDWSSYDKVEFDLTNFVPATDGRGFGVQYYTDGGTTPLTATYSYFISGGNSNTGAAVVVADRGVAHIKISEVAAVGIDNTASGGGLTGVLTLFSPASTAINKKICIDTAQSHATSTVDLLCTNGYGWYYGSQAAINGIKIFDPNGGNISAGAKVTVRGYKTS